MYGEGLGVGELGGYREARVGGCVREQKKDKNKLGGGEGLKESSTHSNPLQVQEKPVHRDVGTCGVGWDTPPQEEEVGSAMKKREGWVCGCVWRRKVRR